MGISNLSDYPAAKVVVACLKCRLRVQYDRAAMIAASGDRPLPTCSPALHGATAARWSTGRRSISMSVAAQPTRSFPTCCARPGSCDGFRGTNSPAGCSGKMVTHSRTRYVAIKFEIRRELAIAKAKRGNDWQVQSIENSWRDTMDDRETLRDVRQLNRTGSMFTRVICAIDG